MCVYVCVVCVCAPGAGAVSGAVSGPPGDPRVRPPECEALSWAGSTQLICQDFHTIAAGAPGPFPPSSFAHLTQVFH